jgi:hypothetical protein
MRSFIDYRREVGMAVWLLSLYWIHSAPSDDPKWSEVAGGAAIRDPAAAKVLKTTTRTARRWRRLLRDTGLIECEPCGGGGYRIRLWRFDQSAAPAEPAAPNATWPEMPTQVIQ